MFLASIMCMKVELESDCHGRKLRASSMLQQPLLQLYFISSCDSTVIAFKQDRLCFHVLFCYQKSSENDETAIGSCKNCHNFKTKRLQKTPIFYFDPCIISRLLVAPLKSQCCQLSRNFVHTQTDRQTEHQITVTLHSAYTSEVLII